MKRVLAVVGITVLLTACSPEQFRQWLDSQGIDHRGWSEQEFNQRLEGVRAYWARVAWENPHDQFAHVLDEGALARLRQCESNHNYGAIGGRGAYRGAYQFARTTWNSVASRHYPQYVGLDPAAAPPKVQDAMARALWAMQGRSPWPICGRRV